MNYCFIVGYPRSGTTLLAGLLSKYEKLSVTPETNYFRSLRTKYSNYYGYNALDLFIKDKRFQDLNTDYSKIIINPEDNTDIIFKKILDNYAKKNNSSLIIEKSPLHANHLNDIWTLFPYAKVINIFRDGRDVILSNLKQSWTTNNSYKHAAEWRELVKYFNSISDNRLFNIKYEDLVVNTDATISKILNFLNMSEFTNTNTVSPLLVPNWESEWKNKALEEPDSNNVYKWKTNKLDKKLDITFRILNKGLIDLNYEPHLSKNNFNLSLLFYLYSNPSYFLLKKIAKFKRILLKKLACILS